MLARACVRVRGEAIDARGAMWREVSILNQRFGQLGERFKESARPDGLEMKIFYSVLRD